MGAREVTAWRSNENAYKCEKRGTLSCIILVKAHGAYVVNMKYFDLVQVDMPLLN